MVRKLLIKIVITAVALWAADYLLTGFSIANGAQGLLIVAVVLGILNTLIRPILKLITLPLILLTFGLFTIVINIGMLLLAANITGLVAFSGLVSLLWAMIIISAVQILLDGILH